MIKLKLPLQTAILYAKNDPNSAYAQVRPERAMRILVLCILLCGCGTYMYPKFVEVAEAACKRNDGWINVYRSYYSKQYYLEITCKDGAVFNETVLEADARP